MKQNIRVLWIASAANLALLCGSGSAIWSSCSRTISAASGVDITGYWFKSTDASYTASLRHLASKMGYVFLAATWASAVQGEPGKREQVLEEIKKWVDVSESLGAPHLRVFAGKPPAGATVQQAIGWTVDTLKAACEYAGRSITLGMKDHEGITQNADVCLEIVHGVDSPFFGINRYNQFHSYWASGRLRTDRSYRPTCNAYSYSRPLPKGGSRRP